MKESKQRVANLFFLSLAFWNLILVGMVLGFMAPDYPSLSVLVRVFLILSPFWATALYTVMSTSQALQEGDS